MDSRNRGKSEKEDFFLKKRTGQDRQNRKTDNRIDRHLPVRKCTNESYDGDKIEDTALKESLRKERKKFKGGESNKSRRSKKQDGTVYRKCYLLKKSSRKTRSFRC